MEAPHRILEAVEEVRRERVRGARWALYRLAKAVIEASEEGSLTCANIEAVSRAIQEANRSMAPVANLAMVVSEACRIGIPPGEAARRLLHYSSLSLEKLREAYASVRPLRRIATLSYSSTVEALIASSSKEVEEVVVLESRPGGEGAILAANLRDAGLKARVVPDTAVVEALSASDALLVGADAVTRDACLVNKLGTRPASIIAKELGVNVVAAFDATKIHPYTTCSDHPIEERTYVVAGYGPVRYKLFDITPSEYITAAITEAGVTSYSEETIRRLQERLIEWIIGG